MPVWSVSAAYESTVAVTVYIIVLVTPLNDGLATTGVPSNIGTTADAARGRSTRTHANTRLDSRSASRIGTSGGLLGLNMIPARCPGKPSVELPPHVELGPEGPEHRDVPTDRLGRPVA